MTWACEFTESGKDDLHELPKGIQKRVARVVTQVTSDPFGGNVKALQGKEWRGVFRRRIGDYRLLFTVDHNRQKILIHQISLRSGKTYR
jgi:mRNA-degrading endonuclease RelE of RelBE toxin-antitoxin system